MEEVTRQPPSIDPAVFIAVSLAHLRDIIHYHARRSRAM